MVERIVWSEAFIVAWDASRAGIQAAAAYGFSGSDGRRFIHLPHSS